MEELKQGVLSLRAGGGCYYFTIKPHCDPIGGLGFDAYLIGPDSVMGSWDAMFSNVLSAGHCIGVRMSSCALFPSPNNGSSVRGRAKLTFAN